MKRLPSTTRSALAVSIPAVVLIALAWIFIHGLIRYERADTIREVERQNANLALAFEAHTVRTVRSAEQVLEFVLHEYRRHGKVDLDELAKAAKLDTDFLSSLVVLNAEGNVAIGGTDGAPVNLSDREFFRFHRDHPGDGLLIGKPLRSRITGRSLFTVSRRIERPAGGFGGVVAAALNPDYFGSYYGSMDIGANGMVLLVGLDGIARVRRVGSESTTGGDMRGSSLLREQANRSSGSFLSVGRVEGVRRYTSYRTLSEYGLVLAVGTSEDEVLAPFYARREIYLWTGGIFTLLVLASASVVLVFLQARRKALRRRRADEARFRATFDQKGIGIAHTGLDGRFLRVNEKLCEMLEYSAAELAQRTFADVTHPEDVPPSEAAKGDAVQRGLIPQFEKRYLTKSGATLWAAVTVTLVKDAAGGPEYFVAMVQDINERKRTQEKVLHQATYDLLTDLANRALFYDRLGQALKQARRQKWAAGVMIVDLDRFKAVNDELGHAAGDALLRQVARRLSGAVRAADTVARVGGDEFAVVLAELAQPGDAAIVARKILEAMAVPMMLEGHERVVTVSIGIALFPTDGEDAETLLRNADAALFRAKRAGRNRFHQNDPSLDEEEAAVA